jgi:hypothetical protein
LNKIAEGIFPSKTSNSLKRNLNSNNFTLEENSVLQKNIFTQTQSIAQSLKLTLIPNQETLSFMGD